MLHEFSYFYKLCTSIFFQGQSIGSWIVWFLFGETSASEASRFPFSFSRPFKDCIFFFFLAVACCLLTNKQVPPVLRVLGPAYMRPVRLRPVRLMPDQTGTFKSVTWARSESMKRLHETGARLQINMNVYMKHAGSFYFSFLVCFIMP